MLISLRYDSVTAAGQLKWQDALTEANALFFESSDAIFTNYTWARPPDPAPPGGLPESPQPTFEHHPALLKSALMAESMGRSPADVYMGIDVFGRNCYGGYEIGRSLDLIFPSRTREYTNKSYISSSRTDAPDTREDLGLSVALFAPGWTWEHEKEGGGERSWGEWWTDEIRFWFGGNTTVDLPEEPGKAAHAICSYFGPRVRHHLSSVSSLGSQSNLPLELTDSGVPHPASRSLPWGSNCEGPRTSRPTFYTNFNRGSGSSWWVYGQKVYDAASSSPHDPVGKLGWTDVGSSFPKPDRIWPRLVSLSFDGQATTAKSIRRLNRIPCARGMIDRAGLVDYDVWQGGSSLEVVFRPQQSYNSEDPINQRTLTTILPLCTLDASHVTSTPITVSLELIIKLFPKQVGNVDIRDLQIRPYLIWASNEVSEECSYHSHIPPSSLGSATFCEMGNGWYSSKTTIQLDYADAVQLAAAGAVVPVVALGIHLPRVLPSGKGLRILMGEIFMSAFPAPRQPAPSPVPPPSLTATSLSSSAGTLRWERVHGPSAASPTSLWGILTWDDNDSIQLDHDRDGDRLSSNYFNVFAFAPKNQRLSEDSQVSVDATDRHRMWLGTSTYEHNHNSFVVAGLEPSDLIQGSNRPIEVIISPSLLMTELTLFPFNS